MKSEISEFVHVQKDGEEEQSTCGNPCDPNSGCDECSDYWRQMESEGFWNRKLHKWTIKGWGEIIK